MTEERRKVGAVERHIQTILGGIAVSAITFVATHIYNGREVTASTAAQLAHVTQQLGEIRAELKTYQSHFATKEQMTDHENRIRAIEQKIK